MIDENTDPLLPRGLLSGKTAFVTGGGSGINFAIADALARCGADISICGRSPERLAEAESRLRARGVGVCASVADVRDSEQLAVAIERTRSELAPLDIVVCGAAGNFLAPAERLSSNGFRTVIDIDLLGSFHAASGCFEQLRSTRGCLLFISSGHSRTPFASQVHVSSAKAGVDALMRGLALEWGRYGIRANTLVPGPVGSTEGMRRLTEITGSQAWTDATALGRFAELEEIARIAVVLCSPLASYVTGAEVFVDGGMNLFGSALFSNAIRAHDGDAS